MAKKRQRGGVNPKSGGTWGQEVRARLRDVMRVEELSSNRAFARACGVYDRRVSDWLNARLPSADNLRQIGDRLGVSVDWLLGFDVPMRRHERSRVGALSVEVSRVLSERRPADAFAPELKDIEPSELVSQLVDEWWRTRLAVRASEAAKKFRELAFEIQKAIRSSDSPEAIREAKYTMNQCHWTAGKLESPLVGWEDVTEFRFAHPASQHIYRSDGPYLETPFDVIGGWAFLWRYPEHDVAIYIERGSEWAALGGVVTKVGTRRRPRFLVEREPIVELRKTRRARRPSRIGKA